MFREVKLQFDELRAFPPTHRKAALRNRRREFDVVFLFAATGSGTTPTDLDAPQRGSGTLPLIWTPPAREASRLWNRDPSLLSSMRPSSQRELSSTSIEPSEKSAWAQTPGAPHAPYAHRVPQSESQIVSLAAGATRPVSGD